MSDVKEISQIERELGQLLSFVVCTPQPFSNWSLQQIERKRQNFLCVALSLYSEIERLKFENDSLRKECEKKGEQIEIVSVNQTVEADYEYDPWDDEKHYWKD